MKLFVTPLHNGSNMNVWKSKRQGYCQDYLVRKKNITAKSGYIIIIMLFFFSTFPLCLFSHSCSQLESVSQIPRVSIWYQTICTMQYTVMHM